ncbi:hypothetical protein MMC32_002401 [Xylographa parallela]|nr:hypothetical protein [Xylographa parallela]
MVKTYGRNWKFMADGFLELRAPLALKNRYSLLMRRLNRPETGQKQAAMNGSAKPSRHAALSHHSSGSTSPLPNSAVDLTSFFSDGMGPQSHQSEYAAMGAAGSDFLLSTGAFSASMMTPSDATTTGGQRGGGEGGGTALWKTTATSAADDQAFIWQQHPVLGSGIEPGSVSSSTGTNEGENRVEEMTTMSENGMSSRREFGPRSAALSDAPAAEVEYLVTCQWGKLKTLMNHLVDAAISESAGWAAEDDQVTVTLRLRAR